MRCGAHDDYRIFHVGRGKAGSEGDAHHDAAETERVMSRRAVVQFVQERNPLSLAGVIGVACAYAVYAYARGRSRR